MDDDELTAMIKRVRRNAPQITADLVSDDDVKEYALDAFMQATADGFKDRVLTIATGWLATHFAAMANNQNNNVSKQKADVLEQDFFDCGGSDDYLAEYLRLKDDLGNGATTVKFY
jgi:GH15 family glucan-1,4-alpha-glucosidase